jgi:isocitrate dehydrogenase
MNSTYKPVVFMNGDDSTRRGALMVKDILYSDFNFIDADTGVNARISSDDQCIAEAARLLAEHGAGIKISTASNDPRIVAKGWKSANIILRPLAGVVGMYRMTHGNGAYKKPVSVMRFGSGDFYAEQSCEPTVLDGHDTRIITQHLNVADLHPFAVAAAKRAKQFNMQMVISSKWTISEGETYLPNICEEEFSKAGLQAGEWRGQGDYYREIADMCAAYIPVNVTPAADCAMSYDNGGWMVVCGNANGDTFADIADLQHGNNKMGSECICRNGSSYYELPGGTAPGRKDSDFKGNKFFSPMATLIAFAGAITTANPEAKSYCDAIFAKAEEYMDNTEQENRCTQTMLDWIAKETKANL